MSHLRAPTHNPTPCQVLRIDTRKGITRLALALDINARAICWYTADELKTINPSADVEAVIRAHEDLAALKEILHMGISYREERYVDEWKLDYQIDVALGRTPPVVTLTPDMIGNERKGIPGIDLGKSSGVVFKDAEAA